MSTGIQWTDRTWNPVTGCTRVSAGCDHCYAQKLHNQRYRANVKAAIDHGQTARELRDSAREVRSATIVQSARAWMTSALPFQQQYDTPFAVVQAWEHKLREPLSWRKPQRVFVNSMADLFHEQVPDEVIDHVFAVMAVTPHITYQVLTKRPERMREYLVDMGRHYSGDVDGEYMERWGDAAVALTGDPCSASGPVEDCGWPLPNVWLGVSVEDQRAADERIPVLLDTPAAVRFLSCEPLLGELNMRQWQPFAWRIDRDFFGSLGPRLNWVIIGGESGSKARPCSIQWIRDLAGQCRAADVPVFVKQLGSRPYDSLGAGGWPCDQGRAEQGWVPEPLSWAPALCSRHGGDPAEWPEDLRVREFPR